MDVAQLAALYKDALAVRDEATRTALSDAVARAAAAAGALDDAKPPTLGAKHTTTGDHVRRAQLMLASRAVDVRVDGKFDNDTKAAVTAFQKGAGLETSGVVDDATWAALNGPHPAADLAAQASAAVESVRASVTDAIGKGGRVTVSDAVVRGIADEATLAETLAAESLAVESAAAEPLAAEPLAAEPLAAEPLAAESLAVESAAAEPLAAEPLAAEPTATEPNALESLAAEPLAAEPLAAEPTAAEPNALENLAAEPLAAEPLAAEPNAAEPNALESLAAEPLAAEPLAAEPVAAEPVAAEPVAAEPVNAESIAVENALGEATLGESTLGVSDEAIAGALRSFVSEHGQDQ